VIESTLSASSFNYKSAIPYLLVAIELILAGLIGFLLLWLGADGGAWILGGIAAGALVFFVYHSRYNPQAQPNRHSRKIGQILVGLTVGFSIQNSNLTELSAQLPTFAILTLLLLCSSGVVGHLYSRLINADLLTGWLASVPGNIGLMASLAADYGKNTSSVALVQLMRFTTVTFAIPMIANVSSSHDVSNTLSSLTKSIFLADPTYTFMLCSVLILAGIAVYFGNKFKVPVAALFCSILVGILFNKILFFLPFSIDSHFGLPPILNLIGQVLLGITIGEYWGINPKLKRSTIAFSSIPVVLTFLVGLLLAGIAMLITPWDWLTCLLVTAPGGSPEMIWIALSLNHDIEIVTTGHLIRLITINLCLPFLMPLSNWFEQLMRSKTVNSLEMGTELAASD
jgi:hypothetical protein